VRGTPQNLFDLVARIDQLPVAREKIVVNVTAMGPTQLPLTTIGLAMGLNIRVGMEDNVMFRRNELLQSNAQLVERAARIAKELDRAPASPAEARSQLGLSGPPKPR
jgi:3-keto-5-aminohexanoate cleavage enzyme